MNCANHSETPATAFCRSCGKPVCDMCKRPAQGTIFCEEHVPAVTAAPPPAPVSSAPPATDPSRAVAGAGPQPHVADPSVSPGVACTLGLFIPGVGAIYNGQYAKGLVHAIVFGLLVSVLSSDSSRGLEPLFAILLGAWVCYMGVEAYHTARKRRAGEPVDEFSSLIDMHLRGSKFPAGAVLLIVVGVLLLLNTTDLIPLDRVLRYWPVLLILIGLYLLFARLAGMGQNDSDQSAHNVREAHHD